MINDKEGHIMELPSKILIGNKIIPDLGNFLNDLNVKNNVLVVSGSNIKHNLEDQIVTSLTQSKINYVWKEIDAATSKIADDVSKMAINLKSSIILGIGGGKSIDTAKLASFNSKMRFVSVPTSASHDGIASPFASIKGSDRPYSLIARPPVGIFADINIISSAPSKLLSSGCGDLIAKMTAVKDWELAHNYTNEPFRKYAASLAYMSSQILFDQSLTFTRQKTDHVRDIVEALISAGVAAGIAGTSRPCSGSEHLISHALDLIAPGKGLHGEKCGIATILMAKLHGLDWQNIKLVLKKLGCPTTIKEIGVTDEQLFEAIRIAPDIRKDRFTILHKLRLQKQEIEDLISTTNLN